MLALTNLGGQVIEPSYMIGSAALGEMTEGVCKQGAGFVCKDVGGGVQACLPCTQAELAIVRNFQEQLNRVVVAYSLGEQYRLDVDGRIGPLTTRTAAVAYQKLGGMRPVSAGMDQALTNATLSNTNVRHMAGLMVYAEELGAWLKGAADAKGVAVKVPEAKPRTIFKPGPVTAPGFPRPRGKGVVIAVGILAMLAAVGLVGTAAHYEQKKRPGPRGRRGPSGRRGTRGKRGRRGTKSTARRR